MIIKRIFKWNRHVNRVKTNEKTNRRRKQRCLEETTIRQLNRVRTNSNNNNNNKRKEDIPPRWDSRRARRLQMNIAGQKGAELLDPKRPKPNLLANWNHLEVRNNRGKFSTNPHFFTTRVSSNRIHHKVKIIAQLRTW